MKNLTKKDIIGLLNTDTPTILDIGTYDGKDSREILFLCPKANIHAFECDPRSLELFKSFEENKKINLHEFALSDKTGEIDFFLSDSETRRHYPSQTSWSASSSIKPAKTHLELFPDVDFKRSIKIQSKTLDVWATENNIEKIDFIWADLNGGEHDFVAGALETLNSKTRYIYIEVSNRELYEGQKTKEDLIKALPNFDEIFYFSNFGNFGNVLLKNRKING